MRYKNAAYRFEGSAFDVSNDVRVMFTNTKHVWVEPVECVYVIPAVSIISSRLFEEQKKIG